MNQSVTLLGVMVLSSLLVSIGLIAILLSLHRRKGVEPFLASFGAFTLFYGLREFAKSDLVPAFGLSPDVATWAIATVDHLIKVPAWIFLWILLGRGWRSVVLFWLWFAGGFAVLGVVLDLITGRPGNLTGVPNNIVVIGGVVILAVALWKAPGRMSLEQRVLAVGVGVFAIFALNENLASLGLLPWRPGNEWIGVIGLVGCLGYIAARRFLGNERQLVALESELETARRIQESILPSLPPEANGLSIATRYRPTSAVAGDLYDFLPGGDGTLGVVVADVSGHGVPAALIASMVKVAVGSQRELRNQPARLLSEVNQTLCGNFQRGFVTATYTYVDPQRRELIVANAGHPHPLLRRRNEVVEVGGRGPILGRFASAVYEEERLPIDQGDRLVLYTDAVIEARGAGDEIFGEERLKAFLNGHVEQLPEAFCIELLEKLRVWVGQKGELTLDDDLTLIVLDLANHGDSESE